MEHKNRENNFRGSLHHLVLMSKLSFPPPSFLRSTSLIFSLSCNSHQSDTASTSLPMSTIHEFCRPGERSCSPLTSCSLSRCTIAVKRPFRRASRVTFAKSSFGVPKMVTRGTQFRSASVRERVNVEEDEAIEETEGDDRGVFGELLSSG